LRRKSNAFCERQFALHRQPPEKYKQNADVAPPGKISADAKERGLVAILTKFADHCYTQRSFSKLG